MKKKAIPAQVEPVVMPDKVRLSLREMMLIKYPCINESELKFVCRTGSNTFNLYIEMHEFNL